MVLIIEVSLEDLILYFSHVVLLKCVSLKVFYFFLKLALHTDVFIHFNKVEEDRSLCLLGFFFPLHNLKWCRLGYVNQMSKVEYVKYKEKLYKSQYKIMTFGNCKMYCIYM